MKQISIDFLSSYLYNVNTINESAYVGIINTNGKRLLCKDFKENICLLDHRLKINEISMNKKDYFSYILDTFSSWKKDIDLNSKSNLAIITDIECFDKVEEALSWLMKE